MKIFDEFIASSARDYYFTFYIFYVSLPSRKDRKAPEAASFPTRKFLGIFFITLYYVS